MESLFTPPMPKPPSSSVKKIDETYNLRGLNLRDPDQIVTNGESPYTINSRMYPREDDENRVAIRTRKGSSHLSIPVGETASVQNVATATGDLPFSETIVVAQPFTASTNGLLTQVELEIKKLLGAAGHVIVEVREDASGLPGRIVAQSSFLNSLVTGSYAYVPCYFIEAPAQVSGDDYWLVVYTQDNGAGTYQLHKTAASGALQLASNDPQTQQISWTQLNSSFRFKTHTSTAGGTLGYFPYNPSSGSNLMALCQGTHVYTVPLGTGAATSIYSAIDATADYFRAIQIDDDMYFADGVKKGQKWNPTDGAADIQNTTSIPKNLMLHENRLFMMVSNTRVEFSELSDFTTWPSDNFFYVPTALSPDPMTGWLEFKGDLWIFTREMKHRIIGQDITTLTRKPLTGTKGAVSQEAMCADNDYMYWLSDDGMVYRSNGVGDDEPIGDKVYPELRAIFDKSKVRFTLYQNQLRIYYPKSPNAIPDTMLLYDLAFKEWFIDTGRSYAGSMELAADANQLVEFSSVAGAIYLGEDSYSDVGKRIDFKYWTQYKTYGAGSARKRIKKFRPIIRTASADYTMTVGKDFDFANTPDMRQYIVADGGAKWGDFIWGDGTRWGSKKLVDNASSMAGRGKYIQYRFERSGVETPVNLYGYISLYKVGKPK